MDGAEKGHIYTFVCFSVHCSYINAVPGGQLQDNNNHCYCDVHAGTLQTQQKCILQGEKNQILRTRCDVHAAARAEPFVFPHGVSFTWLILQRLLPGALIVSPLITAPCGRRPGDMEIPSLTFTPG